jgi:serine protease Do
MSKRMTLFAIGVVTAGLLFGAIIVSGVGGINRSYADPNSSFNLRVPFSPTEGVTELNDAFTSVSSIVTPTVVSINVKSKAPKSPHNFWPFDLVPPRDDEGDQLQEGSGSGIILTTDGYILTNRHVIDGATDDGIKVTLYDSREFPAKLIGSDENTDIAVIHIDAKDLKPAALGNSDDVKVGEWVLAVGNPLGLTSTVTAGIVSAISRNIGILRNTGGAGIENFIQTDAAINPGNSGGALVTLNGQVVGVNTAIASSSGRYIGYGFAVPINLAKVVANGIIKNGRFERGYIGITITSMNASKAKALGLDRFNGVMVENLQDDGAGKAAGLRPGDVIVQVDGRDVLSSNELQARVGTHQPGENVRLKVFRDGKYFDVDVKLKARGENDKLASNDENDDESTGSSMNDRNTLTFEKAGFSVKPLDAAAKKRFDRSTGVLVTSVKPLSPAYDNNLRENVVIFEARRGGTVTNIASVSDLKKVVGSLGSGDSILLRVQTEDGQTAFIPIEGPAL